MWGKGRAFVTSFCWVLSLWFWMSNGSSDGSRCLLEIQRNIQLDQEKEGFMKKAATNTENRDVSKEPIHKDMQNSAKPWNQSSSFLFFSQGRRGAQYQPAWSVPPAGVFVKTSLACRAESVFKLSAYIYTFFDVCSFWRLLACRVPMARCKTFVRCQCREGKTSEMYQAREVYRGHCGPSNVFGMLPTEPTPCRDIARCENCSVGLALPCTIVHEFFTVQVLAFSSCRFWRISSAIPMSSLNGRGSGILDHSKKPCSLKEKKSEDFFKARGMPESFGFGGSSQGFSKILVHIKRWKSVCRSDHL